MQPSPYTPGTVARDVYGRESYLNELRRELLFMSEYPAIQGRIHVYVGPRGVGKTSLLRAVQSEARALGFDSVWATAGDGPLVPVLLEELRELSGNWKEHARNIFTSAANAISVTTGGLKVSPQVGEAASKVPSGVGRQLQKALIAAGQAAHGAGKGLVIFIDEVQAADPEGIRALAYAWQHMQSEAQDVPIMAVTAGLSHAQDVITDAVSFAERFLYQQLHNLEEDDSVAALRSPAQRAGVRWEDEALNVALARTKGYPYFLQVIGDETWKSAGYPKEGETIRLPHINDASENFNHIRESFFRTRWEKATPGENDFLMAMAALGDGAVARKDVATRMGKSTTDISMVRASLMDKGLIDSPERGQLEFTAPGFADYVRRVSGMDDE